MTDYAVASLLDQFFSELRKEPDSVNESGFIAQRSEFVVGNVGECYKLS